MNQITRYLAKTILVTTLLAMLLWVGLEFIFSFVSEIRHVGTGNYGAWEAVLFIILSMPTQIANLFPMSALIGALLGLGILASRSELIIMRVSGMSVGDILRAVLKLAFAFALLVCVMGEWVGPYTDRIAHNQKALALSGGKALRTSHGIWLKDDEDFVHIQAIEEPGRLEGVSRYIFDGQQDLKIASYAHHALFDKDHWVLYNVRQTIFYPDHTDSQKMATQQWVSHIDPKILSLVEVKDLNELSLQGLWSTIQYRQANGLDAGHYQLAFWQKLMRPFAVMIMMFLAIPCIFGPLRSATMGLRILAGVMLGFVFYTFDQLFGPLMLVYHLPPILGACLPSLLFLGAGLLLLKRVH